jgi:low affinity Fe/Cu permease
MKRYNDKITESGTKEVFMLSRGWKITMYILLSILMLVFVAIALGPLFDPSMKKGMAIFLPVSIIIIGLLVCGFLQVQERVILDDYSIRKESRLINREILLNDIKGFKVDQNQLHVIPYKGKGKVIRVSTYMARVQVLGSMLAARYPDLNLQEVQEVYNEAVEQTGEKDIDRNIKRAKIEAYTLTGITVVLCVASYFYFGWFHILLFSCVPLAMLLLIRHKGLVQLDTTKDSPLPSVALIPILVVAAQLLGNSTIQLVNYGQVWKLSLCITAALIVMLWLCSKYLNKKKGTYIIAAIVLSCAFVGNGYGLVVSTNCLLDKMNYEYYETVVTDKSVSRGKTTTYHLTLQPWAHQPESEQETVDREVYDATQINDKVGIYYFKGGLNIPWYIIESPHE